MSTPNDREPFRQILPDVSHCGCILPAGAWGSDGWHHARYTRALLVNKAKRDHLAAGRKPKDFEYAKEFYDAQIGRAFSYEPCPAYRASVSRGIDENRARKAAKSRTYDE